MNILLAIWPRSASTPNKQHVQNNNNNNNNNTNSNSNNNNSNNNNNNNNNKNNFIYIALISWAHGALQCIISKEYIKNQFTVHHILHIIKSFDTNNAPLSKNCLKGYVFNHFLKRVKDGDLRKSNGSEFHSLGTHWKSLSP